MPHQCTNCGKTFDDGSKEMLSGCPDCGGNKFQFQPSGATKSAAKESAEPAGDPGEPDTKPGESATKPVDPDSTPAAGRQTDQREEADVEREMPDLAEEPESAGARETTEDLEPDGVEVDSTGAEDSAQRDARTANATADELDEARRKMAEAAEERSAEVDDDPEGAEDEERSTGRSKRGRGAPQGPPTDPPDEEEVEAFGLSGAVGPPEEQPTTPAADEQEEQEPMGGSDTDLSALREELNDQFESIKITAPGQYELNLMELYDRKEYIISLQEDGRYVVDIPEGHDLED